MSLAEDLLQMLPVFTPAERQEIEKLLRANAPLWVPQVGPQSEALESKADILYYGGQAGGGKTELLLGVALQYQEHSILFRREAVQLTGIEERLTKILGTRKGYNSQTGVWRLPGNRVLELGSVAQPDDWMKYQGRPHDFKCLGRGTPVVMADNTQKPIEQVQIGDVVATLEGPRAVTRTMRVRKLAVLAQATANGITASQVQSRNHELLTPSGWASRDTTQACGVSSPKEPRCACKCAGSSCPTSAPSPSILEGQCHPEERRPAQQQDRGGCQSLWGSCVAEGASAQESGCAASACPPLEAEPLASTSGLPRHPTPVVQSAAQGSAEPSSSRGGADVLSASSLEGLLVHCSCGSHRGGAQLHGAQGAALQCLLLPGDVGQQSPTSFATDDLGRTPTHSPRVASYSHPYTMETRQTQAELVVASLAYSDVGEQELFDLTVDEVNHYITAGGFVNRNCFDEIPHFLESQFRALIGWMRSDNPNVRQRVIGAGNPPTDSEGEWVIRYWAPWLDLNHPNPAKHGELRFFVTGAEGDDVEVPSAAPVQVKGRWVKPKSRTFIPSTVADNLYLSTTGYADTLMQLPEPLRSMMAEGNFQAGRTDHVWQLIPTAWVDAAMQRWQPRAQKGRMTRVGFDPSRGGMDRSSIARRHDNWVDEIITVPGVLTDDGPKAAALLAPVLRDRPPVCVDSIGIGSSALDFMRALGMRCVPIVGSEGVTTRTANGALFFKNKRAELYWRLREDLDPAGPNPLALPPDKELKTELCAHRYKVVQMGNARAGILVRDKDEVREIIGRSPDKADSVTYTCDTRMPSNNDDDAGAFRKLRGYD